LKLLSDLLIAQRCTLRSQMTRLQLG